MSKKNDAQWTPASIAALMSGDLDNFMVAATPGGIERQESEGQKVLCANSAKLPKMASSYQEIDRALFEKMGIIFGEDADDLFVNVTLPEGWKIEPTDHSMWNKLVDKKGRERAAIFYKAAFYDQSASISPRSRFSISKTYCNAEGESAYDSNNPIRFTPTHETYQVKDCGVVVFAATPIPEFDSHKDEDRETRRKRYEEFDKLTLAQYAQCEAWLTERYPNWRDPLAYWD